ncbi:MAG TPA: glycosyltransferase [Pedobacter sp.]|jgi:mannosyltransferase OCH1-like enzyme
MAIPKTIYQTFKTEKLPLIVRWHIKRFRKNNPDYDYQFYDDKRIESFFSEEFSEDVLKAYKRLDIGAAKADMFRYAVLYKKGGMYLDIDSHINCCLSDFIKPDDKAIISPEGNPNLFVQWALIYEANHPFLKKALELILENIKVNRFPHDVHSMTGPTVYTHAIKECLKENPLIPYRLIGVDYEGCLTFKYKWGKFFLYKGKDHWKEQQLTRPVLKPEI